MKMFRKKTGFYLLIAILIMSAYIFAGCNKDDTQKPDATSPSSSTPTNTGSTGTPSGDSTSTPTPTPKTTQFLKPTGNDNLEADFIDLQFNADGSAVNKVKDSVVITTVGSVSISEDTELGVNVANFPGGRNYYRAELSEYYDSIEVGFSIELFVKIMAVPDSGYWGIIDNCENGGFGMELHKTDVQTGRIKFIMHLDGAYNELNADISINKWYHIVMTWDESIMALYVDGELVDEFDSEYAYFKVTQQIGAQYLAIGALCSDPTGGQGYKGSMAVCRMYFKALSKSDVAKLNQLVRGD